MTEVENTSKSMTSPFWETVKAKYPNHWVLIGNPVFDDDKYDMQGGEVLFATDKKDDLVPERRKHKIPCAIHYTGERPKRLIICRL